MSKSKKKERKVPAMFNSVQDLIPDDVLYDTFKFNVWVGCFVAMMGLLASLEQGRDKTKKESGGWMNVALQAMSPAYTVIDWAIGSDETGSGVGLFVDWNEIALQYKPIPDLTEYGLPNPSARKGNALAYTFLKLLGDDFTRWTILSSSFASAVTFNMFERDIPAALAEAIPDSIL